MYTKFTRSGGRSYLQLVEGYRNEAGKVRHRVVANLGRLDDLTPQKLDPLINGLNRVLGRAENTSSDIAHEPAQSFGDVFALHALWTDLGFDRALNRGLRSGRRQLDVEALVRAMVFNRLCAPDSKLGCLRWLDTVAMSAIPETVTHQHLLRAMDALVDHAERVEVELAKQIRPLVDRDLAIVFYDLTTVRIHGEGHVEDDIRAFGMNKEMGSIARQFVLGVVQTADGLPSTVLLEPTAQACRLHTVHPGNVAETKIRGVRIPSRNACASLSGSRRHIRPFVRADSGTPRPAARGRSSRSPLGLNQWRRNGSPSSAIVVSL